MVQEVLNGWDTSVQVTDLEKDEEKTQIGQKSEAQTTEGIKESEQFRQKT